MMEMCAEFVLKYLESCRQMQKLCRCRKFRVRCYVQEMRCFVQINTSKYKCNKEICANRSNKKAPWAVADEGACKNKRVKR